MNETPATANSTRCLRVIIVGAGIGGLTCAIACLQACPTMEVTVLEKVEKIQSIGAGIHIPPNASRILMKFGIIDSLKERKAYNVENFTLRRYQNGDVLASKPLAGRMENDYGAEWLAVHRGDYQQVLLNKAVDMGTEIVINAGVIDVLETAQERTRLVLSDGRVVMADAVIGADGLWSTLRTFVVGKPFPPLETGDVAYRATFSADQLASSDADIDHLLQTSDIQVWLGDAQHAVFYPLRDRSEYNLVLVCKGSPSDSHDGADVTTQFADWDPRLRALISLAGSMLRTPLFHFKSLPCWTRGCTALLGDASHPTLPYVGQGAAMAVEDAAVLGTLLAHVQNTMTGVPAVSQQVINKTTSSAFRVYQDLRKARAEVIVAGAVHTEYYYHLPDGAAQLRRDEALDAASKSGWTASCSFNWGDSEYQSDLLGFDTLQAFDESVQAGSQLSRDF